MRSLLDTVTLPSDGAVELTELPRVEHRLVYGDLVVVERRNTARNGETVVALLDDGEATLKKFYKEGQRVRLQPANPDFKPIYVDNVQIQGVVVGVLRAYR